MAERMVTILMGDKVEPRTRLHQRTTRISIRKIISKGG